MAEDIPPDELPPEEEPEEKKPYVTKRYGYPVVRISDTKEKGFDEGLALGLSSELNGDTETGGSHHDANGILTVWGINMDAHGEKFPQLDKTTVDRKQAVDFYKAEFDVVRAIPAEAEDLRVVVFEGVINGPGHAIRALQRAVGAPVDGGMGPITKAAVKKALDEHGEDYVIRAYLSARKREYEAIIAYNPAKAKNKGGWFNRVDDTGDYYTEVLKNRGV